MALVPGPGPLALAATDATNYQVATGPTHGTCVHMTHGPTFGFAFCFLLFAVQQALAGSRELIMELITNQGITRAFLPGRLVKSEDIHGKRWKGGRREIAARFRGPRACPRGSANSRRFELREFKDSNYKK